MLFPPGDIEVNATARVKILFHDLESVLHQTNLSQLISPYHWVCTFWAGWLQILWITSILWSFTSASMNTVRIYMGMPAHKGITQCLNSDKVNKPSSLGSKCITTWTDKIWALSLSICFIIYNAIWTIANEVHKSGSRPLHQNNSFSQATAGRFPTKITDFHYIFRSLFIFTAPIFIMSISFWRKENGGHEPSPYEVWVDGLWGQSTVYVSFTLSVARSLPASLWQAQGSDVKYP